MDFFAQQDKAKRYTNVLVLYFLIAIALIVVAVNFAIYYFFIFIDFYPHVPENWFSGAIVYYVSAATILLILAGSLFRWLKLRSGGHAVAEIMGGELLNLQTNDAKQRQLIHVVEEMSIASGVPLPTLYVLENENAINAFVAGYRPTETVMVITSGAIEEFSRQEMQAVVAHEYSHILNGDMQINIRLMSALAGILMISSVGRLLLSGSGRHHRQSYSHRNKSSSALSVLGVILLGIGLIGVFFGRMIKAAVSRQREYLADAASVQFTRNPQGMASVLNKIREFQYGSKMQNVFAEDVSHMCFSQAISQQFVKWMATHPPLIERIKCVDNSFLARIKARNLSAKVKARQSEPDQSEPDQSESGRSKPGKSKPGQKTKENTPMSFAENIPENVMGFSAGIEPALIKPVNLVDATGNPAVGHMAFAEQIRDSFSDGLMIEVHNKYSAQLIMLTLVLTKMDFDSGLSFLKKFINEKDVVIINKFKNEISSLKSFQRLPLFDLLLPALKQMNENEKTDFLKLSEALVKSDKRYTLFEFVFMSLLKKHLSINSAENIKVKYHSFSAVNKELQLVFSMMSHCGKLEKENRLIAYEKSVNNFPMTDSGKKLGLLPIKEITLNKLSGALQKLSQLSPLLKRNVIEACADIAMHDGKFHYAEAELLRAIGDLLDSPMPPLLPPVFSSL